MRRIGESRFEIAVGVVVLPICGPNEKRDGWQVVVDGEYDNDFRLKREAIKHAETVAAARRADDLRRDLRPTTDTSPGGTEAAVSEADNAEDREEFDTLIEKTKQLKDSHRRGRLSEQELRQEIRAALSAALLS